MPAPPLPKPDPQMLAIAEKIVEQQAGEFDPAEFVDRYEDALRAMIEEKKKGQPSSRGQAGQRRRQGGRPDGGAEEEPGSRQRFARARRTLRLGQGKAEETGWPQEGGLIMVDIDRLLGEMTEAADRMRIARERLKQLAPDAPDYQSEKVDYLHALVSHMSMVAVTRGRTASRARGHRRSVGRRDENHS